MSASVFDPEKEIPFTQYLMPDGQKKDVWIERPPEIIGKAKVLLSKGVHFETEMLNDWSTISMTAELEMDGEDDTIAAELCTNGPPVLEAVDRLVNEAFRKLILEPAEQQPT